MKKKLVILLLAALTLCGCGTEKQAEETRLPETTAATEAAITETTAATEPTLIPLGSEETLFVCCDTDLLDRPQVDGAPAGSLRWKDSVVRCGSNAEGWSAVQTDGKIRYVQSRYLSKLPPYQVDNDLYLLQEAVLYAEPDAQAQALGALPKGEKLSGARTSLPGWYQVSHQGQEGYLKSELLSLAPPVEESDVTFTPVGEQVVYTIDSVNYRTGPDTEYRLLGEIPAHVRFLRTAMGSNGWDKILYNGIECCCAGNYLTMTPPADFEEPEQTEPSEAPTVPQSDPDGHQHVYEAQIIPPTCLQEGYTNHACACGEQYADTFVPALGHSWGSWTESLPATHQAPGEEIRTCTRCQATQTRPIPQLPADACQHQFAPDGAAPTLVSANGMIGTYQRTLVCSLCGETKTETYEDVCPEAVSQAAADLFSETNALRTQQGLAPLSVASGEWNQWAMLRAREQAELFSHTRPDGSSCWHDVGSETVSGENVAYTSGIYNAALGREFYEIYYNSPPHRANMLGDHQSLAVGVYVDPASHTAYSAMVFISAR